MCARDETLRREVESLIANHEASTSFLASPAANLNRALFANEDQDDYSEGYRVGPYSLDRRIGRGGMGSVWTASLPDTGFRKTVAVKLVKRGMDTQEILRRFRMERQMLASLEHPNIARLIDGGSTSEGLPYLVMEYVEGTRIDQYCESRKCTITERLQLFRAVCSAVQYAHQNLIVHRDIKAANILVTPDGVAKLLDFGIAKLLRNPSSTFELAQTRPDLRPMTLDYASPEQVRGESITTSTDVYSLGVLLYKLLTTKMPYGPETQSILDIQTAIRDREPLRPSAVILSDTNSAIPQATQKLEVVDETRDKARKRLKKKLAGDLDMIILKSLRKEPSRRYASAEQFSEDIRRYLEGRPVIARSDTLGYRTGKFIRRNAGGVIAAAAIAVALLGAALFEAHRARAADLARASDQARIHSMQHEILRTALDFGDAQRRLGNLTGAQSSYRRAFETSQSLESALPGDRATLEESANSAIRLADVLPDGAERASLYTKALAGFEALAAMNSHDLGTTRNVMMAAQKAGSEKLRRGDAAGAVTNYQRALQVAQGLYALSADSAGRKAVADAGLGLGQALVANGAREDGLVKLQEAATYFRQMIEANEKDLEVRQSLAATYQSVGDALDAAGRHIEAMAAHRQADALK